MPTVEKLLAIALGEKGYHEKASNAQLDDKTANSGSKNYTKYARDLFAAGYYNGNKNGYDWCDVFVDWCFWKACGEDAKKAQEMICQTGNLGAGVGYSAKYYMAQGRFFESDPKRGDQIFFYKDGVWTHTGIVTEVKDGKVYTSEGNVNGHVATCVYPLNYATIKGYGRPFYDVEQTEAAPVVSDLDKLAQAVAAEIKASGLDATAVLNRVQKLLEAPEKGETAKPTRAFKETDIVAFKAEATHYRPNGAKISDWTRDYNHVITKLGTKDGVPCALLGKKVEKGKTALLAGINTWVALDNLEHT